MRPVTSLIPVQLLQRTIPIYSRAFFEEQRLTTKSSVKGWTYIRQGVYWCSRALDKYAKGGRAWKVDVDGWREGGRRGRGWEVPGETEEESESEEEASEFEAGSDGDEGEQGEELVDDAEEEEEEGTSGGEEEESHDGEGEAKRAVATRKRKRTTRTTVTPRKLKRAKPTTKAKRAPHPTSSSSHLPATILDAADLPVDPYQRALRLLHVGATPESLPCREEEFVDVLSKVEEGVEGGGGGCLCKGSST